MVLVTLAKNITNSLKKAELIPDFVPEGFISSTLLGIKYPSSGEDVAVGNFIKPSDSADKPQVTFVAPDQDARYTLLMVDPDAPSKENPRFGPFRHWVLTNIPGSADFTQASELSTYMGPAPPPKTGDHRYIFLLYKQAQINASFGILSEKRMKFDYKAFAAQNNLELIGVNFFISRNDDN